MNILIKTTEPWYRWLTVRWISFTPLCVYARVGVRGGAALRAKSLLDCITAGDNPALSSVAITSRQVVPAEARNVIALESISQEPLVKVIAVPSRGML
jgi:hypothetical protein